MSDAQGNVFALSFITHQVIRHTANGWTADSGTDVSQLVADAQGNVFALSFVGHQVFRHTDNNWVADSGTDIGQLVADAQGIVFALSFVGHQVFRHTANGWVADGGTDIGAITTDSQGGVYALSCTDRTVSRRTADAWTPVGQGGLVDTDGSIWFLGNSAVNSNGDLAIYRVNPTRFGQMPVGLASIRVQESAVQAIIRSGMNKCVITYSTDGTVNRQYFQNGKEISSSPSGFSLSDDLAGTFGTIAKVGKDAFQGAIQSAEDGATSGIEVIKDLATGNISKAGDDIVAATVQPTQDVGAAADQAGNDLGHYVNELIHNPAGVISKDTKDTAEFARKYVLPVVVGFFKFFGTILAQSGQHPNPNPPDSRTPDGTTGGYADLPDNPQQGQDAPMPSSQNDTAQDATSSPDDAQQGQDPVVSGSQDDTAQATPSAQPQDPTSSSAESDSIQYLDPISGPIVTVGPPQTGGLDPLTPVTTYTPPGQLKPLDVKAMVNVPLEEDTHDCAYAASNRLNKGLGLELTAVPPDENGEGGSGATYGGNFGKILTSHDFESESLQTKGENASATYDKTFTPQVGDFVVIKTEAKLQGQSNGWGHVAMWNGKHWVSQDDDYVNFMGDSGDPRNPNVYQNSSNYNVTSIEVFRYKGERISPDTVAGAL